MNRRAAAIAIAIAVAALGGSAAAQPTRLRSGQFKPGPREDRAPIIEILTFGVGDRIFEKFGHGAICLRYHDKAIAPVCFNYGVTDFNAGSSLVWGFLRDAQPFWVEPSSYGSMFSFYRGEDRDIWRQRLPLADGEARAIERDVWASLDARHSTYTYDHFYDNCTTKLRDFIDRATGGKLRARADTPYPLTYRELGLRGLAELPVLVALTDFLIGRPLDVHPTMWGAMFHPAVFRAVLEVQLGAVPELIYARKGHAFATTGSSGRLEMFAIAMVFALPLLAARVRRSRAAVIAVDTLFAAALGFALWRIADAGALIVGIAGAAAVAAMLLAHVLRWRGELAGLAWAALYLGLWGTLVWGLAIVSAIPGIRWNEVVLVLMPFDAALPFVRAERRRRYARYRVAGLLLVSLLAAIGVLVQPLGLPILSALAPLAILALDLRVGRSDDERA